MANARSKSMLETNSSTVHSVSKRNRSRLQSIRDGNSFTRLVDADYGSRAHSEPHKELGKPRLKLDMEEEESFTNGIMVTTVITVTQEERIANVLGI